MYLFNIIKKYKNREKISRNRVFCCELRAVLFKARRSMLIANCVRDCSGILLERSGKRYSGKPDAKRNAPKKRLMTKG